LATHKFKFEENIPIFTKVTTICMKLGYQQNVKSKL